ncbi:MAG: divalent metal cation transporter [Actinobacteria bacterium]|nr:divalent metal cation transporter [Actinomycetota bacterium]MCL5882948.1 divalent metal cation transporter [Actinomycetota bacterium]
MIDKMKGFFRSLGPGLITGASDDDPSGIGTYAVAGASLGFSVLWTTIMMFPMMVAVQYICTKIGMVSGAGLSKTIRQNYSRWILAPVVGGLMIANTINAGADIGAVAAGINLLVPVPIALMIAPIAIIILAIEIWGNYRLIDRIFKYLTLALLAYIGSAFFARPDAVEVLRGTLVPTLSLDSTYLSTLVALLGTTITPYLFFWQPSQEIEEEQSHGEKTRAQRRGATKKELRVMERDTTSGMLFSEIVAYFIIMATAATLNASGNTNIGSATEAAEALRPLAGNGATVLMALGLIGAGMLAIPILTGSASYALAEAMGWKYGLDRKARQARHFYIAIAASTIVGMLINFIGINPISALFGSAVINGFLAPPLLVIIMLMSSSRRVMGRRRNAPITNIAGWFTTAVMFAAAAGLVWTWFSQ